MRKRYALSLFFLQANPLQAAEQTALDIQRIFLAAPFIYTILLLMSFLATVICLYALMSLHMRGLMPRSFVEDVKKHLSKNEVDKALACCENYPSGEIVKLALQNRQHGSQLIFKAMQSAGKRLGVLLWQRISFLQDIASIAPMLGLLGTVLGMFYAFYSRSEQSIDSFSSIFDGFGIAMGTTVAGLIVAILSTIFHAILKFRLVHLLSKIESESLSLANYIAENTSE